MFGRFAPSSPRSATLFFSSALLALLALVMAFVPVPYVRLTPGPTTDTLGSQGGTPLITIEGRKTYPVTGRLELTTVAISSADHKMGLFEALAGWLRSEVAIVPRENVYEEGKSNEEIKRINVQEMALSQKHATYAALTQLGIKSEDHVVVAQTTEGTPAWGKLQLKDWIDSVDGVAVDEPGDVVEAVRKHKPGEKVTFVVQRCTQPEQDPCKERTKQTVVVTTTKLPDDAKLPYVGIQADRDYTFPFAVKIHLDEVGGPSAGLMFALGIVDRLNEEDMTGGRTVAGTGTIDDSGTVGKIGGIAMKILGAKKAGATVFMVPAGNCREALNNPPEDITLVAVDTLKTAMTALEAIRNGKPVPTCQAAAQKAAAARR
jgi:Lon-like protease